MTGRPLFTAFLVVAASLAVAVPALLASGCSKQASAQSSAKTYATRGTIKSFGAERKLVNIAHEDIPGYMSAMTMSFEPSGPKQLDGFGVGDKVAFSFTDDDGRRVLVTFAKAP